MVYRVTLSKIVWDDGKGEYDVSALPRTLRMIVSAAPDKRAALEYAMDDASEEYGSLIAGCSAHVEAEPSGAN